MDKQMGAISGISMMQSMAEVGVPRNVERKLEMGERGQRAP